jgi:hypothetical protein
LFVVGPVVITCLLLLALLQAEVWVVVAVCVKPAFEFGGFVTGVTAVPQSLTFCAWAGENQAPPTAAEVKANPTSNAFSMLRSYSVLG